MRRGGKELTYQLVHHRNHPVQIIVRKESESIGLGRVDSNQLSDLANLRQLLMQHELGESGSEDERLEGSGVEGSPSRGNARRRVRSG